MAENDQLIKAVGYFNGHNSKGNFDVQLKMRFPERSLPEALQFVAGIGKKIQLIADVNGNKIKLGKFTVYNLKIDRDANCDITFKSNIDNALVDNFSGLMVEEAEILLKAKVLNEEA